MKFSNPGGGGGGGGSGKSFTTAKTRNCAYHNCAVVSVSMTLLAMVCFTRTFQRPLKTVGGISWYSLQVELF